MTDLMTLDFLIKCKKRLEKHGVFIIKENIPNLTFFNNKSSKKCRSLDGYIMLFNLAKLEILKIKKILCCPNSLCEMFEFVLAMRKEA